MPCAARRGSWPGARTQSTIDGSVTMTAESWRSTVEWSLVQIRTCSERPVRGCSPREIEALQTTCGVRLPAAYVRFLEVVGVDCGDFLRGSDLALEWLAGNQSGARALLEDDAGPPLPEDAFVFCSHQGYQFLFFIANGDPDPEVRDYLEHESYRVVAPSYSAWLAQAVRDEFPRIADQEPPDPQ